MGVLTGIKLCNLHVRSNYRTTVWILGWRKGEKIGQDNTSSITMQSLFVRILKRQPFLLEHCWNIENLSEQDSLYCHLPENYWPRHRNLHDMLWDLCAMRSLCNWPWQHIASRNPKPEVRLTLFSCWKCTSQFHKNSLFLLPDEPVSS